MASLSHMLRLQCHGRLFLLFVVLAIFFTHVYATWHLLNIEPLLHANQSCSMTQDFLKLPSQSVSSPQELQVDTGNARLKVLHRHGACPLASPAQILAADQRRVEWIHRRASAAKGPTAVSSASMPAEIGATLGTANYVVNVGLGTPSKDFTVIMDTGSDLLWVQCLPCKLHCHEQSGPLFDPANSSTYDDVPCTSRHCSELYNHRCSSRRCVYTVRYGDGSYTAGYYSRDTLTLASDTLENFRFGCGENNQGVTFGETAGLLGLSRAKTSVITQGQAKYESSFAYCLPATPSGTGYLAFGADAQTTNAKFTPMLTHKPTYYYVQMTGIRVLGEPLPFRPFDAILDSGTVITRLPLGTYAALRSAFVKAMSAYKPVPGSELFDACFDFADETEISVPDIALVFAGGVSLDVDPSGVLYPESESVLCLAFAPYSEPAGPAIIGNHQQKTFSILHDVGKKVVGFTPGAC